MGTRRRLQALAALGWSLSELANRAGVTTNAVKNWRAARRQRVEAKTAHTVRVLYDQLSMHPPAHTPSNQSVRAHARRQGWAPPLAWDDEELDDPDAAPSGVGYDRKSPTADEIDWVVVSRLLASRPTPRALTRAEKHVVIRYGASRGWRTVYLASLVDMSATTIRRLRGVPAPQQKARAA